MTEVDRPIRAEFLGIAFPEHGDSQNSEESDDQQNENPFVLHT